MSVFIVLLAVFVVFYQDSFAQAGPSVTLDQESYTWTERVGIRVENGDLAGSGFVLVSISTDGHSLQEYRLDESQSSPGVFLGIVTLTGFEYDAFGGSQPIMPETSGSGPTKGKLEAVPGDTLRVEYSYGNSAFSDEADISWTVGIIRLDVSDCQPHADCEVIVEDKDMNTHPEKIDHLLEITVRSDSYAQGVTVTMVETDDNTGVFRGKFVITPDEASIAQRLFVNEGDTITAEYHDRTPPAPSPMSVPLLVLANAVFGVPENWALGEISKAGQDGITILTENPDVYFTTVNGLADRLDGEGMSYDIQNSAEYEDGKMVLTKRLTFEVTAPDQFERIFGKDPRAFLNRFNGEKVDEDYIARVVSLELESCRQRSDDSDYCFKNSQVLTNMILDKKGTHTITESVVLEQIEKALSDAHPDLEYYTSELREAQYSGSPGFDDADSYLLSQMGSIHQTSLIPSASGQQGGRLYVSIPSGTGVQGCENTSECYIPAVAEITPGETVVWTNDDSASHTITSGDQHNGPDGLFDSSLILAGSEYEVPFESPGEYPYFCIVHPWMSGIIVVAPQGTPLPREEHESDTHFSERIRFLNGFTLGYGFGKTWTYEYNVGFPVLYVEAHVEAGLGMGLRIPVDVKVEIDKNPGSVNTIPHQTSLTINTRDLSESDYEKILPPGKTFEGKEFNVYLGPAAHIDVQLFGVSVFERAEGVPKPKGTDFVPPLESKKVQFTEFDVDICKVVEVCPPLKVATVSLSAGVGANMLGHEITLDVDPQDSVGGRGEFRFTSNGQKDGSIYRVAADPFLMSIQNVQYRADLHFIPRMNVNLSTEYIPFTIVDVTFEFPGIEYRDLVLGTHEGTPEIYTVPEFDTLVAVMLAVAVALALAFGRLGNDRITRIGDQPRA